MQIDINKSIEEIENSIWPDPQYDSYVIKKTSEYRKTPIKHLSPEACRLLIEQEIGIEYILPSVLEMLKKDILISGDLYDGDLLNAVTNIKNKYWESNKALYNQLKNIIENTIIEDEEISKAMDKLKEIGEFA